jgi:hypothetical protein
MGNEKRRWSTSSDDEQEIEDFMHGFSLHSPSEQQILKVDFKEIPNPECEYLRSKLTLAFHKSFEEKVKSLLHTRFAPKDTLNRFLYEQLSFRNTSKPGQNHSINIPKPENVFYLDTIDKEVLAAFPLTSNLKELKGSQWKLEKNIKDCLQIGYAFFRETGLYANHRYLQEILNDKKNFSISDEFLKYYGSIREKYFRPYRPLFEQKIKDIKVLLFLGLKELIKKMCVIDQTSKDRIAVDIENDSDKNFNFIRYKDCEFKMTKYHFRKLEKLFEFAHKGDRKSSVSFNEIVFCLICRYQSFFRNNEQINEGYGMQASLPSTVLAELNASFEVTQEMFASPFNCFFRNYCSAFSDTDVFFGSNGSFFDFEPETGTKLFFYCEKLKLMTFKISK